MERSVPKLMEKLDILLVNPGNRTQMFGNLSYSLSAIEPPLWCGLLSAFFRERGYSVKIIDADAENSSPEDTAAKIAEANPFLTGIIVLGANPSASSTPKMTAAGEILRALRERAPHIKTIIGGLHPSALPERTLREEKVDFVCQGEGFHTIGQLLEILRSGDKAEVYNVPGLHYIRNGKVASNPPAPLVNPDNLPMAAWDLLPMDRYRAHNWHCFDDIDQRQPYAVIYTSLGCPFHCHYCNIHALYNGQRGIRFRSPERVVVEIDFLVKNYHVRNIKILDELFTIRGDRVAQICDLIIQGGYDLNMWAYARVDTVNEGMLKKMKQAGINWVGFGIESASRRVRTIAAKKFDQNVIREAVAMAHEAGMYVMGNFIFGLPDDDLGTMQETLEMTKELNLEYVNFYTAMAYPGSQLYEDAIRQGIRLPSTWHGYGQYSDEALPLPTKYLSAEEVLRFRDQAFKEYFNHPKYVEMVRCKFGDKVVKHISDMLRYEVRKKPYPAKSLAERKI